MVYLLDTNIVSLALRGRSPAAVARLAATARADVAISVITAMELRFGLAKHPGVAARRAVERFLTTIPIAAIPVEIDRVYGRIRASLERRGTPIGPLDTIIAAHALTLGATLVTNNVKEFRRVPGLMCEDWT